jgi:hypothetical protein
LTATLSDFTFYITKICNSHYTGDIKMASFLYIATAIGLFIVTQPDKHRGCMCAAVEVGGTLISNDSAKKWNLVEGSDGSPDFDRDLGSMIHPDVHSITVPPTSSDFVTAATGGGLYRSNDGGRIWKNIYRCYIRAIWVDPANPQHLIAGPADGVSRNGRIEESNDGGYTWQLASDGVAPAPWSRHMVERFVQLDNDLFLDWFSEP